MPEFCTPFNTKKSDRKLTKEELIRAIRFSIASEYEAIQIYEELEESIDSQEAKKLLHEIAEDEKVHAGSFFYLLKVLDPGEDICYKKGITEAKEVIAAKDN